MNSERIHDLRRMAENWGVILDNYEYVNQALTHPTYVFENKNRGLKHNQRLEFLGDAVLGLAVGDFLFHEYPNHPEGDLTKMRAAVVCEASLADQARGLGLGRYLLLGRGEELNGGRERTSILADAFEAVIGAIYLTAGLKTAKNFVLKYLGEMIKRLDMENYGDYKTMLQEFVQKYGEHRVSYLILDESGPDHNKRFEAGVMYKEKLLARGTGNSKKEAEQKAAQVALKNINQWKAIVEV
jgi:ribonuclease-3